MPILGSPYVPKTDLRRVHNPNKIRAYKGVVNPVKYLLGSSELIEFRQSNGPKEQLVKNSE